MLFSDMSKLMSRAGRAESDGVSAAVDRKPLRKGEANEGKHVLSQICLGALGQILSSLQASGLTPAPNDGG
jgi:hypothetical protein